MIKLRWRFTLIFTALAAVTLLLTYFFLSARLKNYFEKTITVGMRNQIMLARDIVRGDIGRVSGQELYRIAGSIAGHSGLRVTIIGDGGKVLADSGVPYEKISLMENHGDRPEIKSAALSGLGISRRYSYTIKKYLLYMAVPIERSGAGGFLRFAMPLAQFNDIDRDLRGIVFISLLMVCLVSILLNYLILLYVSRPLVEMAQITKAIARGDFSRRPPVFTRDEVGELASSLRDMSQGIKDNIDAIRAEKVKLDAVLFSMFEGIVAVDEKGKISLMNPSLRKQFFIEGDPVGKTLLEVIRNAAVQDLVDDLLLHDCRVLSSEVSIAHPEEKVFKVSGSQIVNNGILSGAVLVFHDLTELKKLEEMRRDFVANVSHELRTPVASIKGYAETLLDGALEDKKNARAFLNIIYQDSNRLANIIDDLLGLARIESGRAQPVCSALEVEPVLRKILSLLERQFAEKSLRLTLSLARGLPRVMADDTMFSQVLLNLLDNAVKYTPQGGSIEVKAELRDGFVRFDIVDTGVGIPEKDIARIFERFYRVDRARSRDMGGTGLGLSIVKHIVQALGGQVWVASALGRGSTFSFTLPAA